MDPSTTTGAGSSADRSPSAVAGTVVEGRSGVALGDVRVRWLEVEGDDLTELAAGVSDDDGAFTLTIGDGCARAASVVVAEDHEGAPLGPPVAVTAERRELTIRLSGGPGREPGPEHWRALADYLTTNRMLLARDVVGQLSHPFPDSPVLAWGTSQRAGALRAVVDAIGHELDRTSEFMESVYADAFVDTAALAEGDVASAVTAFTDARNFPELRERDLVHPALPKSELVLYRDYLRSIWVAAAKQMYKHGIFGAWPDASAATLERQLDERFHQDFHTNDTSARPAANLLAPLVKAVLQRPTERGGFGLQPAAIPAQGPQTDDQYLAALVALTGESRAELRNRFRVSLERRPQETVSPVGLNVEALLGLLSDTYQSPEEPFAATPSVVEGKPLIFLYSRIAGSTSAGYLGTAPFFLQYEEWRDRQRTFFPENVYDVRRTIPRLDEAFRKAIAATKTAPAAPATPSGKDTYFNHYPGEITASAEWVEKLYPVVDTLGEALAQIDAEIYPEALRKLDAAEAAAGAAVKGHHRDWSVDKFWWWGEYNSWNNDSAANSRHGTRDHLVSLADRAKQPVRNRDQLARFEAFFDVPVYGGWHQFEKRLAQARSVYIYALEYYRDVLIPYLRASICSAQGDYGAALAELADLSAYRVGIGEPTATAPYAATDSSALFQAGTLPYTTTVSFDSEGEYGPAEGLAGPRSKKIAPFEQRFFQLAQGEVMLTWADELFRNDDPSSIRRARELYKGVLFMHGEDPGVAPDFPRDGARPRSELFPGFWRFQENPAKVSQTSRARYGLFLIGEGLNVYGYRDDLVPVLRYRSLKEAADSFAMAAQSAQRDFLTYQANFEQAQIDAWQARALARKATAGVGIAAERTELAQAGVAKANEQVAAVKGQIAAKEAEIADADSLFGQFKQFVSGAKDALDGMVPVAQKATGAASSAQFYEMVGKGFASEGAGPSTSLAGAAAPAIGFGLFAYAGISSMSAMETAMKRRDDDLAALKKVALPAAEGQVRLREREVAITRYESEIAQADLELATALVRFQQDRFLNATFWRTLKTLAGRLMRRYVDLAARNGWLAERALAFEQHRSIHTIRFDYFRGATRGVTASDRLLGDLAELEAARLHGVRLRTPVKHTVSLARDFPVAFGLLKRTGRCSLHTSEAALRQAYPGTFGYRIRAVTVAAQSPGVPPPRGVLRNGGVSTSSRVDGEPGVLVRFPDALALSEFRLHDDLFVYGFPGETLMQFEGSGYEADWELELTPHADAQGLRPLSDILVTFELNASYDDAARLDPPQGSVTRAVMMAASVWDPDGLSVLRSAMGPARVTFDTTRLALSAQESGRTVSNLAIMCVQAPSLDASATLTATQSGTVASIAFDDGLALSNAGPLLGTGPALPLNAIVGTPADQRFVLDIDRSGVAAQLSRLADVVLYLEYHATLS